MKRNQLTTLAGLVGIAFAAFLAYRGQYDSALSLVITSLGLIAAKDALINRKTKINNNDEANRNSKEGS